MLDQWVIPWLAKIVVVEVVSGEVTPAAVRMKSAVRVVGKEACGIE